MSDTVKLYDLPPRSVAIPVNIDDVKVLLALVDNVVGGVPPTGVPDVDRDDVRHHIAQRVAVAWQNPPDEDGVVGVHILPDSDVILIVDPAEVHLLILAIDGLTLAGDDLEKLRGIRRSLNHRYKQLRRKVDA